MLDSACASHCHCPCRNITDISAIGSPWMWVQLLYFNMPGRKKALMISHHSSSSQWKWECWIQEQQVTLKALVWIAVWVWTKGTVSIVEVWVTLITPVTLIIFPYPRQNLTIYFPALLLKKAKCIVLLFSGVHQRLVLFWRKRNVEGPRALSTLCTPRS